RAADAGARVVVFPELSLCAYTAYDLLFSQTLIDGCERALTDYIAQTADLPVISFVGLPVRAFGRLYNCAAAVCRGELLGLVPKFALGDYGEFCESRWFARPARTPVPIEYAGQTTALGCDQIFVCREAPDLAIAAEICEDVWVSAPVSCSHTAAGATTVVNLCASDEFFGKSELRRQLTVMQSRKACCAYVLADAGEGESTTDMVFAGNHIACQLGDVLAEKAPFSDGDTLFCTLDVGAVAMNRLRANFVCHTDGYRFRSFSLPLTECEILPAPDRMPFVPRDGSGPRTALAIQTTALASRMRHVGARSLIVGLSGGLDSTLALLVCVRAADKVGLDRRSVYAVTLPCFGTSARTRGNAEALARALGVSFETVDIGDAVARHLDDIGHPRDLCDVTYENAQARERTQVLFDLANARGGLVVGTGDLSELALGWTTYGGDHLSMYGVNASVPKTLVRAIVADCAAAAATEDPALGRTLTDILDTPVSPELLPPKDGEITQSTEALIGPYELHDFFLWHLVRNGPSPRKILRLTRAAFGGVYDDATIRRTLALFLRRFFAQQFKRSCLPDGPKVTAVSLSPRSDWRMPSDASADLWLSELDEIG
ncbi:MAG: NAD(+) synthase, partial [Clostridia bacterium]|nr:NAD(+) synthase [Clostridia bacterium]